MIQEGDQLKLFEILRPNTDDEAQQTEAKTGQDKKGQHRNRMRDGEIDKEKRSTQNDQANEQRFGCRSPPHNRSRSPEKLTGADEAPRRWCPKIWENKCQRMRFAVAWVMTDNIINPGTMKAP